MANKGQETVTEEIVARYYQLSQQSKAIEKEMSQLKGIFNAHFDQMVGEHTKGELICGDYKLQRQVRESEQYIEDKTVERLEELNLTDCIQHVKRPDSQKIDAAITLGLLSPQALEDCKKRKVSSAIYLREL